MGKAPAYLMYAQDFDMDTASWSSEEVGMYLRLLNYEWVNGGIPSDIQEIARIVREPLPENNKRFHVKFERKLCEFNVKMVRILSKFTSKSHQNHTIIANGFLINSRMEEVRENQLKYRESQAQKGRHSAEKRWAGHITRVIPPVTVRLQPKDKSSISISSSSSKDIKKNKILSDDEFLLSLKEKFTWVDFDKEMVKMDAWFLANPGRQKTRRFMVKWISKVEKPLEFEKSIKPIEPVKYVDRDGTVGEWGAKG